MKNINSTLLSHARTSIFIAHRLRTVVEAGEVLHNLSCALLSDLLCVAFFWGPDLIIVLKDGGVFEQGTHEELMLARGLYYLMWQEQQAADTVSESPAVVE